MSWAKRLVLGSRLQRGRHCRCAICLNLTNPRSDVDAAPSPRAGLNS
ncbi:hypothetical protein KIF59_19315 [Enterobacter cloacae subsp. cloacae]|nr:hypothetical protein [Enterobacter cloacae subsp. cloacae]